MTRVWLLLWCVYCVSAQTTPCSTCTFKNNVCACTPPPQNGICVPKSSCTSATVQCFSGWDISTDCTTQLAAVPCNIQPDAGTCNSANCGHGTCATCVESGNYDSYSNPCASCAPDNVGASPLNQCIVNSGACNLPTSITVTLGAVFATVVKKFINNGVVAGQCVTNSVQMANLKQTLCGTTGQSNSFYTLSDTATNGDFVNVPCLSFVGTQTCNSGWGGPDCAHSCQLGSVNPTCGQFGSCIQNLNANTYNCSCPPNQRGDACQIPCPEDEFGNVCSAHGTCQTDATCQCAAGYVGPKCQYLCSAQCSGQSCTYPGKGGISGNVTCLCNSDQIGSQCQFNCPALCNQHTQCSITTCGTFQCECNGRGQLVKNQTSGVYDVCMCDAGYAGSQCQRDYTNVACGQGQSPYIAVTPYTRFTCINGVKGCITGYILDGNGNCV